MSAFNLLAAATADVPDRLDPVRLFLDADIVVQLVIAGLVLASIWVWMIIVSFTVRIGNARKRSLAFEREFFSREDVEALLAGRRGDSAAARVAAAGLGELKRSTSVKKFDADATRERVALVLEGQVASEADNLAERLNFLATTGAVAPFVGLFGTVWGIMNSFFQIGQQQNSSLAVVAPGISEALFATAIGLFAAIPAVIAYNRFSHQVNGLEARLQRFADRLLGEFSRGLDKA
jgi:biopolymer transport protein TolQ